MLLSYKWMGLDWVGSLCGAIIRASLRDANHSPLTPGYLMNSRAEFEQGSVARVVVAHGL